MILVVVESPTKAKHIRDMLDRNYRVVATLGHLFDLPADDLGIDVAAGFEPQWVKAKGKMDTITRIKEAASQADRIVVAMDPDREGEGIAKHVYDLIPKSKRKVVERAEFREITKSGVLHGLSNTRDLNQDMADSQLARRVMDRMVGYMVSPLLWRQMRGKGGGSLSAGRVQSVALYLIWQRQKEIDQFEKAEYWTVEGTFADQVGKTFVASLVAMDGKSLEEEPIRSKLAVGERVEWLEGMDYEAETVRTGEKLYYAPDPFITTTLLQAASSQLGFDSKKTMKIAQELFEGVSVGGEASGLITYMRTDSPRVAPEARSAARQWIERTYGKEMADRSEGVDYALREGAQDGHECIRPTQIDLLPEMLEGVLSGDQLGLYELTYWRFLLSQMAPAKHFEVTATIIGHGSGHTAEFHAFSSRCLVKGWKSLLESDNKQREQIPLEGLSVGDPVEPERFDSTQHFTKAPPRYSEASLIKALERFGIGRPSTYASIMDTLKRREYVVQDKKKFFDITDAGRTVIALLAKIFPDILDVRFTAGMEEHLDLIARGELPWREPVKLLYDRIQAVDQSGM